MTHSAIIKNWNKLTDINHHGEALEMLALYIGAAKDGKILRHVNAICEVEGEFPNGLRAYRNEIQGNVFKLAREVMGDDFDKLN